MFRWFSVSPTMGYTRKIPQNSHLKSGRQCWTMHFRDASFWDPIGRDVQFQDEGFRKCSKTRSAVCPATRPCYLIVCLAPRWFQGCCWYLLMLTNGRGSRGTSRKTHWCHSSRPKEQYLGSPAVAQWLLLSLLSLLLESLYEMARFFQFSVQVGTAGRLVWRLPPVYMEQPVHEKTQCRSAWLCHLCCQDLTVTKYTYITHRYN